MKGLLFTYLMTYGGAFVSLANPFFGLLVYVCFAIIKPEYMWSFSVPHGNYSRIIAIALLTGWLAKGFGNWQFGRATAVVYSLIGFLVWSALSAVQAPDNGRSWAFVEETAKIVLPFLVGITTITSIGQLRALAWVILLSQGYVAYELNLSYYQGFNQAAVYGFGGMDNNSLAIAMNSCIGLAFFMGLYSVRWWQRAAALALALLMAHVVLFTFSRGGMLGLVVTGIVCFCLVPKKPIYYVVLVVVIMAVLRLAGREVRERFYSSFAPSEELDASAAGRLELWQDLFDAAIRNPVLGLGPNQWRQIAHTYGWTLGKSGHSLWLEVAAELGFVGLLWLILFYGSCIKRLFELLRAPPTFGDPWIRYLAYMIVATLAGFAVSAQFVSMVGLEVPYYITLLGAGVLKLSSVPAESLGFVRDTMPMRDATFPSEAVLNATPRMGEGLG